MFLQLFTNMNLSSFSYCLGVVSELSCHLQFIRKQLPQQQRRWHSYCSQGKLGVCSSPFHPTHPPLPSRSHTNRGCQPAVQAGVSFETSCSGSEWSPERSEKRRIPFSSVIQESQISLLRFDALKIFLQIYFKCHEVVFRFHMLIKTKKREKKHVDGQISLED